MRIKSGDCQNGQIFSDSSYICVMEKIAQQNEKRVGKPIPTGVATFYRSEKFEEIEKPQSGRGSGLVLFLSSKCSAFLELAVGNNHLVGDPHQADKQVQQLQGVLKNMVQSRQCIRLVCCDMNSHCAADCAVGQLTAGQA